MSRGDGTEIPTEDDRVVVVGQKPVFQHSLDEVMEKLRWRDEGTDERKGRLMERGDGEVYVCMYGVVVWCMVKVMERGWDGRCCPAA